MKSNSRSGFMSIWLLGLLVLVILLSGVGQYAWKHANQLGTHCGTAVRSAGLEGELGGVCNAIGHTMTLFRQRMESMLNASEFGDTMNLEEFAAHAARTFSNAAIGFGAPGLKQYIDPNVFKAPDGIHDPFKLSISRGAYGQNLLKQGNTQQGLNYLHSSASSGDAGILSQLTLGNAFASGSHGVPKDPMRARSYYGQANQSLQSLRSQNTPQARSLLGALPASPDAMTRSLKSALQR